MDNFYKKIRLVFIAPNWKNCAVCLVAASFAGDALGEGLTPKIRTTLSAKN